MKADNGDGQRLQAARLREGVVEVQWRDGHEASYHPSWLRHSPGFPGGGRPAGEDGRFRRGSGGPVPRRAEVTADGGLRLEWSDRRVSEHAGDWLRLNEYARNPDSRRRRVRPWDADGQREHSVFTYADFAESEDSRIALFEQLIDHGVALLRGLPTEDNRLLEVANWLGHVPANLYADISEQPAVGNVRVDPRVPVATSQCHFLGPHTDTCWRQTLSGLVLLHCLQSHPAGGRSIVVDGFAVAERLRAEDPAAFDLLARVPLDFESRVAERDDWRVMGRVLSVAADGTLEGIRYNGNSIGQLDLPADLIEPMYAALESFDTILYDRSLWWQPQLEPGDLLIVDNHRVLHGREAFDPSAGVRHLQTCSVDRDDFHNRYRRLARRLGLPGADQRLAVGVI
jgi:gamma-butyrobetaine dioxygenase